MKTQRRHDLHTNLLADYLGRQLQQLRPHAKQISVTGLFVLLAFVLGMYMWGHRRATLEVDWAEFFRAFDDRNANSLDEVIQSRGDRPAALWARQALGDVKLASGSGGLFVDRKAAEASLNEAEKHFRVVEKDGGSYPLLVERARFGLAQVYESLSDTQKAKQYYEKVAADPNSPLAKVAKRRAEQLADDSVQGWYAWFAKQEPVVAPRASGKPGTPEPKAPLDIESVPEKSDLKAPAIEGTPQPKPTPVPDAPQAKPASVEPAPAKATPEKPAPAAATK